jgi:hypothetical protein
MNNHCCPASLTTLRNKRSEVRRWPKCEHIGAKHSKGIVILVYTGKYFTFHLVCFVYTFFIIQERCGLLRVCYNLYIEKSSFL